MLLPSTGTKIDDAKFAIAIVLALAPMKYHKSTLDFLKLQIKFSNFIRKYYAKSYLALAIAILRLSVDFCKS